MKNQHGFPSISALRITLFAQQKWLRKNFNPNDLDDGEGNTGTDVRLRVHDGGWYLYTGSSDYDQDHRGFWGSGSLPYHRTNLTSLAEELIEQAREQEACSV